MKKIKEFYDSIEVFKVLEKNEFSFYLFGESLYDLYKDRDAHYMDVVVDVKDYDDYKKFKKILNPEIDDNYEIKSLPLSECYLENEFLIEFYIYNKKELDINISDFIKRNCKISTFFLMYSNNIFTKLNELNDIDSKIIKPSLISSEYEIDPIYINEFLLQNPDYIMKILRVSAEDKLLIDVKTADAIHNNKKLLNNDELYDDELIKYEFNRIIMSNNAFSIFSDFADVFSVIFPPINYMVGFNQHSRFHKYDVWMHSLMTFKEVVKSDDLILKITTLFHDIAKPICYTSEWVNGIEVGHFQGHPKRGAEVMFDLLNNIGYSENIVNTVCKLIEHHDDNFDTYNNIKKLLDEIGYDRKTFERFYMLKKADYEAHSLAIQEIYPVDFNEVPKIYELILKDKDELKVTHLKVNGHDMIDLGFKGKEIGQILNRVLEEVKKELLVNEKIKILEFIKTIKKEELV